MLFIQEIFIDMCTTGDTEMTRTQILPIRSLQSSEGDRAHTRGTQSYVS